MKRIFIVLASILLVGCFELKDKDAYDIITIEEKIREVYETGAKHDTIFLDLTFGMTEKEVEQVLKENYKKGKLEKSASKGKYNYTFYLKNSAYKKCKGVLVPEYHNNRLYKLTVNLLIMSLFDKEKNKAIMDAMFNLYKEKYDFDYKVYRLGDYNYYDLKGNRAIRFDYSQEEIVYTDMGPEYEIREAENKKKQELYKKEKKEQEKGNKESLDDL